MGYKFRIKKKISMFLINVGLISTKYLIILHYNLNACRYYYLTCITIDVSLVTIKLER